MHGHNEIISDPWLKEAQQGTSRPADLRLACSYDLNIGPFTIDEATFYRRIGGRDELWLDGGCVYAVVATGDELSACLNLLERLFYARRISYWPEKFIAGGIVDESAFGGLLQRIERELDENSEKARQNETEIVRVARELGLGPQPTGNGPDSWYATCPGTNHVIFISAAENEFGCGWCCRKGSPDDLRALSRNGRTSSEQRDPRSECSRDAAMPSCPTFGTIARLCAELRADFAGRRQARWRMARESGSSAWKR